MKIFQMFRIALICGFLAGFASAVAEDVDPASDGSQYAWAANLGWLNAEPLGDGGPGLSLSDQSASGWLWSANSGWISLSCENTSSCASVDYGVVNDGEGQLSGYAWSPTIGWISFSCADSSSCGSVEYGVEIDPASGAMSVMTVGAGPQFPQRPRRHRSQAIAEVDQIYRNLSVRLQAKGIVLGARISISSRWRTRTRLGN